MKRKYIHIYIVGLLLGQKKKKALIDRYNNAKRFEEWKQFALHMQEMNRVIEQSGCKLPIQQSREDYYRHRETIERQIDIHQFQYNKDVPKEVKHICYSINQFTKMLLDQHGYTLHELQNEYSFLSKLPLKPFFHNLEHN